MKYYRLSYGAFVSKRSSRFVPKLILTIIQGELIGLLMDYSCWAFQNSYFIVNPRSSLFNCPFGASIKLLSFSTNLQLFTHPWTPYLYLEIEMLLIDRFSVFGRLIRKK